MQPVLMVSSGSAHAAALRSQALAGLGPPRVAACSFWLLTLHGAGACMSDSLAWRLRQSAPARGPGKYQAHCARSGLAPSTPVASVALEIVRHAVSRLSTADHACHEQQRNSAQMLA